MTAWPDPHPDGAPPREEEYSRVTDPQRYRIAVARARVWAEGLGRVPGWPFEALTDACRDLAAGGRPGEAGTVRRTATTPGAREAPG